MGMGIRKILLYCSSTFDSELRAGALGILLLLLLRLRSSLLLADTALGRAPFLTGAAEGVSYFVEDNDGDRPTDCSGIFNRCDISGSSY